MNTFLIIIRGPLGIGKSTISKALAKEINAEYISIDEVLEENNLDKIKGECIPSKNFLKANKLILIEIRDILKKRSVIIEGNFYYKEQIEDLIKNSKSRYYIFTLKAPLEVCIERDKGRKKVYGEEAVKVVHGLVSRFDYGINIYTNNKTIKQVVNEIKKRIKWK